MTGLSPINAPGWTNQARPGALCFGSFEIGLFTPKSMLLCVVRFLLA